MQCTPQEIAEKKRLAQIKLQQKRDAGTSPTISGVQNYSHNTHPSPMKRFNKKPYEKPTMQFYGKSEVTTETCNLISDERHPGTSRTVSGVQNYSHNTRPSPMKRFNKKPYEKPIIQFYGKSEVTTGTCHLISDERFDIHLSTYNTAVINVFKTIPSRLYNVSTKHWSFHIKDYELLQSKVKALQPEVLIGKLPAYVLNCCRLPKPDYDAIDLSSIEEELLNSLMPFQEEGVRFAIDKNGKCLIGDDMGLGKTFQALAVANYYKNDWPMLIVTTASMKNVWDETIFKYMPGVSIMEVQYMISAKDYIGDANILIVSYDIMTRALEKLLERKFGVIIIDESHTLKNFKAKCTKAAIALTQKAKRIVLLSGTPILSRPSEFYTQLCLIDDKFFGNFFEYSKRYCDGKNSPFGWDASGQSNLQELEIILAKKFMIRRTKEDVLKMLPNKIQEVVTLDVNLDQFSEEDRRCLNNLADQYNTQKRGAEKHAALLTFFAESSRIKIPSVCSYILQVLEQTKKFLVFAHHQKMLDSIQQILKKKGVLFIRIDGNTTSVQRRYLIEKFQCCEEYVCAILSITAASAGITLTAAQLIIFAELHWNPSILSQAESRAHRIGQDGQVVVKYLLAPGTADHPMWQLLQKKQKILNEVGLSKDSFTELAVTKQDMSTPKPIATCLNTSVTNHDTLDIKSYFQLSEDKKINMSEEEINFFNDDFDDVLGSLDL